MSVPPLAQLLTPGPIFPGAFRMFFLVLRVTPQPPLRIVLGQRVVFFCLRPSGTVGSFSATHSLCVWAQQSLPFFPAFLVMTQASAGEGRACPGGWLGGGTAGSESANGARSPAPQPWGKPRARFPLPSLQQRRRTPPRTLLTCMEGSAMGLG